MLTNLPTSKPLTADQFSCVHKTSPALSDQYRSYQSSLRNYSYVFGRAVGTSLIVAGLASLFKNVKVLKAAGAIGFIFGAVIGHEIIRERIEENNIRVTNLLDDTSVFAYNTLALDRLASLFPNNFRLVHTSGESPTFHLEIAGFEGSIDEIVAKEIDPNYKAIANVLPGGKSTYPIQIKSLYHFFLATKFFDATKEKLKTEGGKAQAIHALVAAAKKPVTNLRVKLREALDSKLEVEFISHSISHAFSDAHLDGRTQGEAEVQICYLLDNLCDYTHPKTDTDAKSLELISLITQRLESLISLLYPEDGDEPSDSAKGLQATLASSWAADGTTPKEHLEKQLKVFQRFLSLQHWVNSEFPRDDDLGIKFTPVVMV